MIDKVKIQTFLLNHFHFGLDFTVRIFGVQLAVCHCQHILRLDFSQPTLQTNVKEVEETKLYSKLHTLSFINMLLLRVSYLNDYRVTQN